MKKSFTFKVPVKTIISGEHAVVYGAPAVVAAANLYNIFQVSRLKKPLVSVILNRRKFAYHLVEIFDLLKNKKKRSKFRRERTPGFESGLKLILLETLKYFKKFPKSGTKIEIKTQIEPGSGLGHSAGLTAGIAKALFSRHDFFYTKKNLKMIVSNCEKVFHGKSSGVDETAILEGGVLWFRKRKRLVVKNFIFNQNNTLDFLLINTGKPISSTKEAVAKVRRYSFKNRTRFKKILRNFERVTWQLRKSLLENKVQIVLEKIRKNQKLLAEIGVSSKSADKLVLKIEQIGGAAKITGAGTARGENVGMMLATHPNQKVLEKLLRNEKIKYFKIKLGVPGVK